MDISYLLWLQELRSSLPSFIQAFFSFLGSEEAIYVLLVIPCFAYWCLDKRRGSVVLLSYALGSVCNQLLKSTFCIYRPWVRDHRILPDEVAIEGATGYSFPSGHAQATASTMGGIGWAWRDKVRWPLVLAAAMTLLMAFSRNLLGVHTPQDVLVGMGVGFLFALLAERLLAWVDVQAGRDLTGLVVACVLLALFLAYVTLKPYPMDYVDGSLVVDPEEMTIDCYKSAGAAGGIIIGMFIERQWVHFETGVLTAKRIALRMGVGLALLALFHFPVGHAIVDVLGDSWGESLRYLISFAMSVAAAPACFTRIERALGL